MLSRAKIAELLRAATQESPTRRPLPEPSRHCAAPDCPTRARYHTTGGSFCAPHLRQYFRASAA